MSGIILGVVAKKKIPPIAYISILKNNIIFVLIYQLFLLKKI